MPLVRSLLLLAALAIAAVLIAVHGVRAIGFLVGLALVLTIPKTRIWTVTERWLVRLTGSRRRAAVLAMLLVIGAVAAANILPLLS